MSSSPERFVSLRAVIITSSCMTTPPAKREASGSLLEGGFTISSDFDLTLCNAPSITGSGEKALWLFER
jgi:hypothetical protein